MLYFARILIYSKLLLNYETPKYSFIHSHNLWGIVLGEGIKKERLYLAPTQFTV